MRSRLDGNNGPGNHMFKKKPKALKVSHLGEIDELTRSGKPVLVDFYQVGCAPCQVMDGIMNELAREYGPSAHVVKADIANMPDAIARYKIRSTPTMVLLGTPPKKRSKKSRERNGGVDKGRGGRGTVTQRWRASGLVQKDQLTRLLESNGARRVSA
jgi:thiol-disulfide isomerase/thioredoxin